MLNKDFSYDLRSPIQCNESLIEFLSMSFMISASLFTAVEYKLFEHISSGKKTETDIAQLVNLPLNQVNKMLAFCSGLGLIENSEAGWSNTAVASKLLIEGSSESIVPILRHYKDHVYNVFGNLGRALETERNQFVQWATGRDETEFYAELEKKNGEYAKFLKAMNLFSRGVGRAIIESGLISNDSALVDIGCGGGQVALEILQENPGIKMTLVDKAEALDVAREVLSSIPSNQVCFIDEDILLPSKLQKDSADVILISAVLGDWGRKEQEIILANAYDVLKPGGRLIISETLLKDDNSGPLLPAIMSLYVLLLTKNGSNFTGRDLVNLIRCSGFEECSVIDMKQRGLRDIVFGKKPLASHYQKVSHENN